ncbi:MAG: hypothetical protein K6F00_09410 [Lachnospiraceae bacterium]|nr:hypothetical protein [Lachnospiraceae bacterium]
MDDKTIFIIVIIVNTLVAFLYLNVSLMYTAENKLKQLRADPLEKKVYEEQDLDKVKITIFFVLQLICPVAGPVFVGMAFIARKLFFRREVDLSEVIFSKEKVESHNPADVEKESNIVPMEEALAVTDYINLRMLMLNVLKGDISAYLASIAKALNSQDSETAHYAASVLRDELNDFRGNAQEMANALEKADKEETEKIGVRMVEYMNAFLVQEVFSPMEQESFVEMMADGANAVYERKRQALKPAHYEAVSLRLLEIGDYKKATDWANRLMAEYPDELCSYTTSLKLYFKTSDRERFFIVMGDLMDSAIVLDSETMDIVRTFM